MVKCMVWWAARRRIAWETYTLIWEWSVCEDQEDIGVLITNIQSNKQNGGSMLMIMEEGCGSEAV